MVWDPQYNALNLRAIADNIMAYWQLHQEEVFTWLGEPALPLIKDFNDSVANRAIPVFPSVSFMSDSDASDYTGDLITAGYQMGHELMVVDADPDVCVVQAKLYARALISMLVNCPANTLIAGVGPVVKEPVVEDTTSTFSEILANTEQTEFMQRVRLAATVRVYGSLFAV